MIGEQEEKERKKEEGMKRKEEYKKISKRYRTILAGLADGKIALPRDNTVYSRLSKTGLRNYRQPKQIKMSIDQKSHDELVLSRLAVD